MAEIHASYRRTFQVKPYETETIELSITDEVADVDQRGRGAVGRAEGLADLVKDMHMCLADVGDRVVLERMAAAPQVPVKTPSSGIIPLPGSDPWAPRP